MLQTQTAQNLTIRRINMSTALEIKNIEKRFGSRTVLNKISFETKTGEVFGLLGPNGAGKTTLIKMITGLLNIDDGEILINGKSLEHDFEAAMENIGAIVENPEFYKYMTGKQNILQYARLHKSVTIERVNEVIELVGLSNRINEKVGKYSLGMRQRLGLAITLLHNPKVLILDEPTNGLDPAGIKQLRDILTNMAHKEDVCVLVSSHLMSEMELMCDRVAILSNGNILSVDTMENMLHIVSGQDVTYNFEVSDSNSAITIITDYNPDIVNSITGDTTFELKINRDSSKDIVSTITDLLVKNKISIYAIIPIENQKLEDAFMEITNVNGGNQIA